MGVEVSIEHEGPVLVGGRVEAEVVVDAESERGIDAITLELVGTIFRWDARTNVQETIPVFKEVQRLSEATRLPPGRRRYRASFQLPDDAPPSHFNGDELTIRYELRACVEIPWRIDPRAECVVNVTLPPPALRGEPRRVTAASAGKKSDPSIELALDDVYWAPGEVITGAFSIANLDALTSGGATIAVRPAAGALGGGFPGQDTIFKSLFGLSDGSVVHFALPIPTGAQPSFTSRSGSVSRVLVVELDGTWNRCMIPIVIDAFEPREGVAAQAGELLGGDRWRRAWSEVAASKGLALTGYGLELRGELAFGAARAIVRSEHNTLTASLRWASLGIGLEMVQKKRFWPSGTDLSSVDPALAERFVAGGYDEAQVRAFASGVCAHLLAFQSVKLDDSGAHAVVPAPPSDTAALLGFLGQLEALAEAVVVARERLPPPSWVSAQSAAAWRAFAKTTGGTLLAGPMRVRGAVVDGYPVVLESLLDSEGRAAATRVVLSLDPPVELADPPALPDELRLAAAGHTTDDRGPQPQRFHVQPDSITVELGGFVHDPGSLRRLLAEMCRLAARLGGHTGHGPYR